LAATGPTYRKPAAVCPVGQVCLRLTKANPRPPANSPATTIPAITIGNADPFESFEPEPEFEPAGALGADVTTRSASAFESVAAGDSVRFEGSVGTEAVGALEAVAALSAGLGLAVAVGLGLEVAVGLGLAVGAGLGVAVGAGVDVAVGTGVGVGVGARVGVEVGAAVSTYVLKAKSPPTPSGAHAAPFHSA
jgi:hypothetical protein